jgi:hypothetical protein
VEQAAAQYLGPVHKLWEAGARTRDSFHAGTGLLAKAKVSESPCAPGGRKNAHLCSSIQGLSLSMLELLLGSEHLMLDYEEDTFALVTAWVDGRREREAAFNRLWPCLRLHHMSPIFLTSVVAEDKMAAKVGYRRIMNAVAYQSIAVCLGLLALDVVHKGPFASLPPSRAPKHPAPYLFEAHIDLEDCKSFKYTEMAEVMLGVAAGYRVSLEVQKSREPATVGLFVAFTPVSSVAGPAVPGPFARVRIKTDEKVTTYDNAFSVGLGVGFRDFFQKPWEEVVCDGSPYFPQGRMSVKVAIQFLTDRHVEPAAVQLPC